MKGPVKLSLAIALALAGGNAFALGLGVIRVKSGLNQPLDAEIPVISESPSEVNGLNVDMASAEDFERIGLSRARLTVPIEMSVGTNASGQTVVKLTTKDPVREPLLDFLIVANWPNGKLLREYTVLLDPPITAPARTSATVAPVAEKPAAQAHPLPESRPAPKPSHAQPKPPMAAPAKAPPKPEAKAAPAPAPAPKPAAKAAGGNDYGPVAEGETLSEIARATRPDEKTSVNQMMLALLKANPKAFYQDNINALKRGAILRIPTNDDVRATGSVREAIEEVRSQNEAWTGRAPVSAPTLVAHTGATTKPPAEAPPKAAPKPAKQEHLALVPPGKGHGEASTERAGTAGGTGKENAEVKAELARTKEALASREQEATELKSRVKQLEDIGSKDQRLLSMKDSEIADLQRKLKELQAKAAAAPAAAAPAVAAATKPTETAPAKPGEPAAAAKPEQKITAKDIWGDLGAGETGAKKPAGGAAPSTTPSGTTAPAAATAAGSAPATPAPPTAATNPPASATPGEGSVAAAPPAPPAAAPAKPPAPAKPAASSTKAIKPSAPTKVTPLAPEPEPFYKSQNVLLGGGAALVLVGLFALFRFMRRPKPMLATGGDMDEGGAVADEEELRLRDALEQNPANVTASLELLRHYYSQGDAAKFEAAAESMHAHLMDPGAPEWDEVLAMGAVLAPNHPLFSAVAEPAPAHMDMDDMSHMPDLAHMPAEAPTEEHVEFDYPEHETAHEDAGRTQIAAYDLDAAGAGHDAVPELAPRPVAAAPEHDDGFDFDLPLQSEETPPEAVVAAPVHAPVPMPEPEAERVTAEMPAAERVNDIYVGEDAIGTKLDLAKAYLDMGDPEGARSMLDEVMNEGNESQKDEARKLLAEIR